MYKILNDDWQSFTNTIPCAMAKFILNKDLTILCANDAFYALSGRTREQYQKEVLDKGALVMYKEDFAGLFDKVTDKLQAGELVDIEYRIIRRNGTVAWTHLQCKQIDVCYGFPVVQGVFMDISYLKELQQELEYTNKRFQIVASIINEVFFEYDIEKDTMTYSGNYNNFYNNSSIVPDYIKYITDTDDIYFEDKKLLLSYLAKVCAGNQESSIDIRIKGYNQEYMWYNIESVSLFNTEGKPYQIVGGIANVNDQKLYEDHLKKIAEKDFLTNLYNQITTKSLIDNALREERRRCHTLLLMDIDNFKYANDTYGHQFGDLVLNSMGNLLNDLFRATDIVGRVGGDEFVVLIRNFENEDMIKEKLNSLMDKAKNIIIGNNIHYTLSLSIGVCIKKAESVCTYKELFSKADIVLYEAKRNGKNQFKLCSW